MSHTDEGAAAAAVQWVRGTIRAEMAKKRISYADLTEALRNLYELEGDEWNEKNVANKVARGTFSAVFFVQCLEAMAVDTLKLDMAEFMIMHRDKTKHDPRDDGAVARTRHEIKSMLETNDRAGASSPEKPTLSHEKN